MAGGRKLSFDKDLALEAAMQVFWQKGYVGASLSDLTKAMGINKPSMYSTFGNKESLFNQATNLYVEKRAQPHLDWLDKPGLNLYEKIRGFLMSALNGQCRSSVPKGCYVSACISESSNDSVPAHTRDMILKINRRTQAAIHNLLLKDKESIALGFDKRAKDIALSLNTLINGTAIMARAGKGENELALVVDIMLAGIGLQASR